MVTSLAAVGAASAVAAAATPTASHPLALALSCVRTIHGPKRMRASACARAFVGFLFTQAHAIENTVARSIFFTCASFYRF